jgi:hypothetical protein
MRLDSRSTVPDSSKHSGSRVQPGVINGRTRAEHEPLDTFEHARDLKRPPMAIAETDFFGTNRADSIR